jgi:hypothetical protein
MLICRLIRYMARGRRGVSLAVDFSLAVKIFSLAVPVSLQ